LNFIHTIIHKFKVLQLSFAFLTIEKALLILQLLIWKQEENKISKDLSLIQSQLIYFKLTQTIFS